MTDREKTYAAAIRRGSGLIVVDNTLRGVMAVADAEQAELRAEIELLRTISTVNGVADMRHTIDALNKRAQAAEAEVERLRAAYLACDLDRLSRAKAAEAALAELRGKVTAMADAVERLRSYRVRADELRGLLGSQTYSGDSKTAATWHPGQGPSDG